jgi:DNA-binding IclR family transcriptional regulator
MPSGTRLDHWLQLIRGEFQEVPDLRVTLEQAAVLWNLEPRDLELILDTFVDAGFLRRSPAGSYFQLQPRGVTTATARFSPGVDRRQQGMAPDPGIPRG